MILFTLTAISALGIHYKRQSFKMKNESINQKTENVTKEHFLDKTKNNAAEEQQVQPTAQQPENKLAIVIHQDDKGVRDLTEKPVSFRIVKEKRPISLAIDKNGKYFGSIANDKKVQIVKLFSSIRSLKFLTKQRDKLESLFNQYKRRIKLKRQTEALFTQFKETNKLKHQIDTCFIL